ncbi:MAG: hypothetical protein O3C40_26630 [Planctomycetota bacterium]|nr:hypothetical protein [Planctomycetota bacterium]
MTIIASCTCGAKLKAPPELAGKRVKCPSCGQPIAIPIPSDASSEEIDPLAISASNDDPLGLGDLSTDFAFGGSLPQGQVLPSLGANAYAVSGTGPSPAAHRNKDEREEFRREFGDVEDRTYSRVPYLVSVYGVILIGVFSLNVLLNLLFTIWGLVAIIAGGANSEEQMTFLLICGVILAINCLVSFPFVRLAIGLANGYRSSVYGLLFLLVAALTFGVGCFVIREFLFAFIILGVSAMLFVPPAVASLRNWDAFQ